MIDNNNFYANNISGDQESYNELDTAIANQALDKVCNICETCYTHHGVVIFYVFKCNDFEEVKGQQSNKRVIVKGLGPAPHRRYAPDPTPLAPLIIRQWFPLIDSVQRRRETFQF